MGKKLPVKECKVKIAFCDATKTAVGIVNIVGYDRFSDWHQRFDGRFYCIFNATYNGAEGQYIEIAAKDVNTIIEIEE